MIISHLIKHRWPWLVVGAPGSSDKNEAGAALLYLPEDPTTLTSPWVFQQRILSPPDASGERLPGGSRFGNSLALSDDFLMVGAPGAGTFAVFKWNSLTSTFSGVQGALVPDLGLDTSDGACVSIEVSCDFAYCTIPTGDTLGTSLVVYKISGEDVGRVDNGLSQVDEVIGADGVTVNGVHAECGSSKVIYGLLAADGSSPGGYLVFDTEDGTHKLVQSQDATANVGPFIAGAGVWTAFDDGVNVHLYAPNQNLEARDTTYLTGVGVYSNYAVSGGLVGKTLNSTGHLVTITESGTAITTWNQTAPPNSWTQRYTYENTNPPDVSVSVYDKAVRDVYSGIWAVGCSACRTSTGGVGMFYDPAAEIVELRDVPSYGQYLVYGLYGGGVFAVLVIVMIFFSYVNNRVRGPKNNVLFTPDKDGRARVVKSSYEVEVPDSAARKDTKDKADKEIVSRQARKVTRTRTKDKEEATTPLVNPEVSGATEAAIKAGKTSPPKRGASPKRDASPKRKASRARKKSTASPKKARAAATPAPPADPAPPLPTEERPATAALEAHANKVLKKLEKEGK